MNDILYEKIIPITPVVKGNTYQGKPSENFRKYMREVGDYLTEATVINEPVNVQMVFHMPTKRTANLLSLQCGCISALTGCNILADSTSNIVASVDGSRVFYGCEKPRTEIVITKAGDNGE